MEYFIPLNWWVSPNQSTNSVIFQNYFVWLDDKIYMKDKRAKEQPEHIWQLRPNCGVFSKALRDIKLFWIYNIISSLGSWG